MRSRRLDYKLIWHQRFVDKLTVLHLSYIHECSESTIIGICNPETIRVNLIDEFKEWCKENKVIKQTKGPLRIIEHSIVWELFFIKGKKYKEIAKELSIPDSYARSVVKGISLSNRHELQAWKESKGLV